MNCFGEERCAPVFSCRWGLPVVMCFVLCLWPTQSSAGWRNLTTADGLTHNNVGALLEDWAGNMWLGTSGGGISSYDGLAWTTYTVETTAGGLISNDIRAFVEDRSGNLWCGTQGGVSRYDGSTWTVYTNETTAGGLVGNDIRALVEDRLGNMWCGTNEGVSRYDGLTWTTYTTASTGGGLSSNRVMAVAEDRAGDLWFGTWGGGACRYNGASWVVYPMTGGLTRFVSAVLEDMAGNLWFGTGGGGVLRYDGETWTTYTTAGGLADGDVVALLEDHAGVLWVGTERGGVGVFDGSTWTTYTMSDGLAANTVNALIEDQVGNIWFGTFGGGVSIYDGSAWITHTAQSTGGGLAPGRVQSLLVDQAQNLWFGTRAGVSQYDGANWTRYTRAEGLAGDRINAMCEDRTGDIWFGTESGLSRYDGVEWTDYTHELNSPWVNAVIEDRVGDLWFGTMGAGVNRYDGSRWFFYSTLDGLAGYDVRAVLEDREGVLWFGTWDGGVSRFDGSNWTTYTIADGLADNSVNAILEDREGALWFATEGGGVSRYDGATWKSYTTMDGLASNSVSAVLQDHAGNLWFGTKGGGTSRYDGERWANFAASDGLANSNVFAVLEDHSDHVWFGSLEGVTQYVPDVVPSRAVVVARPPFVVSSRTVSVSFGAAFGERRVAFSHSLDDAVWSLWSTSTSFTGMFSDGSHVFRVRARDYSGNVQRDTTVVVFEVDATPPEPIILPSSIEQPLKGTVVISGRASDARFKEYSLRYRPEGAASWDSTMSVLIATAFDPVMDGVLAEWDVSEVPDGPYELRLDVTDTLGLIGSDLTRVIVDNQAPSADMTSPVYLRRDTGGHLFTQDGLARLYLPPRAMAGDALVTLELLDGSGLPGNPQSTSDYLTGFRIDFAGVDLEKAGTLNAQIVAGAEIGEGAPVAYSLSLDDTWTRQGGTVDGHSISIPIHVAGSYGIFLEEVAPEGRPSVTGLTFTPRVLARTGIYSVDEVAISFTLGRSGPVTARVFNRAGRLVRELAVGSYFRAGENVVRWDGRDASGNIVPDGVFLVVVEYANQRESKSLAVVR